jgi:uncharacterized protein YbaP (TraB family)
MMQAAMDETSVAEALDADQKAAFDAYATAVGLPAGALDQFEPWMAGLTLSTLVLQKAGLTGEGVDPHFFERAKADGKERVAFETVAIQTAAFDDLAVEDQVAFLMAGIEDEPDAATEMLGRMVDAWATGDDDGLAAIMTDEMSATSAVFEALLTNRNRAWVPQIEALLAREGQDALVVVGAGHLVGDDSVIAMLRAAGYTVERL